MDINYSFGGRRKNQGENILLAALAHAIDPTIDLELLFRVVNCDLCAKGVPIENGHHILLGVEIPCDATEQCVHPTGSNVAQNDEVSPDEVPASDSQGESVASG